MPVITNISFLDNHPFKKRTPLAGFPFLKDIFQSGFFVPKSSVVESWTVTNLFFLLWSLASFLDRLSFHTHLFESIDFLLSMVRNFTCFFCILSLDLPLAALAPEAGFSGLSREETDNPTEIFEQYLECTETAMASAVLTVEADD